LHGHAHGSHETADAAGCEQDRLAVQRVERENAADLPLHTREVVERRMLSLARERPGLELPDGVGEEDPVGEAIHEGIPSLREYVRVFG